MKPSRTVVVPIGVPQSGRGLGLGLAALLHGFAKVEGRGIALAQLHAKPTEDGGAPSPVEVFIPPSAWRELAAQGHAPEDVDVVVTGQFEPPGEGKGLVEIVAFDAKTGHLVSRGDAHVDAGSAGRMIVSALLDAWGPLHGELGSLSEIGDLSWDALESVLLAERCALFDPLRGGPHDRLAALAHLGRAVLDAPGAHYPAARLAAFAIETALAPGVDRRVARSALRTLSRATSDAPAQLELLEASAALHLRIGEAAEAEVVVASALGLDPTRARLYVLLSEARRLQGNLEAALEATTLGQRAAGDDPHVLTERGLVLAAQGSLAEAERSWRAVLASHPLHAPAFSNLARLAASRHDTTGMQSLVDHALARSLAVDAKPHPELLRNALELALLGEPEGVARAARVAKLATKILELHPQDRWAELALARSLAQMGEVERARERLARIETEAAGTLPAAEAQRGRLALGNAAVAKEVEALMRSAESADTRSLDKIIQRAHALGALHGAWPAYLASAVALRRKKRFEEARAELDLGLRIAAGASPLHAEMVKVLSALGQGEAALSAAKRTRELEGESPRSLGALVEALASAGRVDEARALCARGAALFPNDPRVDEARLFLEARARANLGFWRRLFRKA